MNFLRVLKVKQAINRAIPEFNPTPAAKLTFHFAEFSGIADIEIVYQDTIVIDVWIVLNGMSAIILVVIMARGHSTLAFSSAPVLLSADQKRTSP